MGKFFFLNNSVKLQPPPQKNPMYVKKTKHQKNKTKQKL